MISSNTTDRKMVENQEVLKKNNKKSPKRKQPVNKVPKTEQNNNLNNHKSSENNKEEMLAIYQPWVIQTYGDLAKTKTITIKKYARILRTLRGDEIVSADNSKFRFWVKAKGFCVGQPADYEPKPADGIVGRYSVCDSDEGIPPVNEKLSGSAKDPPLYVPNAPFKNSSGDIVYRKVAIVENFFDIIYNVHVDLEGRPGKHAGQKRTYRTITETYAFLPREAVTRFLLGCTECQKHPRSPSPASLLPTPCPSPTLPAITQNTHHQTAMECSIAIPTATSLSTPMTPVNPVLQSQNDDSGTTGNFFGLKNGVFASTAPSHTPPPSSTTQHDPPRASPKKELPLKPKTPEPKRSSNPLDVCNLTSKDPPKSPPKKRHYDAIPKLWSPVDTIESDEPHKKKMMLTGPDIDYSLPITTTYLKYMRSLGCKDEDAFKFDNKHVSLVIDRLLHEIISDYFH